MGQILHSFLTSTFSRPNQGCMQPHRVFRFGHVTPHIRSVCIEAGMFAIRARRKTVTEKDMIDAVNKVIKGYSKFSATPKYLVYN